MGFFISGGGSVAASPISDVKDSVRVATTANITLSGLQTIDGVALNANDRVLVKNQTAGQDNGIYLASSGAWSRSPDADSNSEVTSGMIVAVTEGATFGDKIFILTTNDPISLGVTSLVFQPYGVEIDPLSLHTNGDNSMSGNINFSAGDTYSIGSDDGVNRKAVRDIYLDRTLNINSETGSGRIRWGTFPTLYAEIRGDSSFGMRLTSDAVRFRFGSSIGPQYAYFDPGLVEWYQNHTWVTDNLYDVGSANGGTTLRRPRDIYVGRDVKVGQNVRITGNLGVGNSTAATTLGTVTKKIEIFDAAGNSLGFIPVYDSIT